MSQLTVQLSDRADALIAQLQKEIFQRRRKKVSAAGVIETLVESGAKSQSDKRFATSWKNLVADIEKAARLADAHGARPAGLSDEEWVLVLSHRTRSAAPAVPRKARTTRAAKAKAPAPTSSRAAARKTVAAAPASESVVPAKAKAKPRTKAKVRPAAKAKAAAGTPPATKVPARRSTSRKPRVVEPALTPAVESVSANGNAPAPVSTV
ncbi:MAG: hypothetical protein ACK55R_08085 [Cyanobacteriota bacterium]|jgi:hypothetical protein